MPWTIPDVGVLPPEDRGLAAELLRGAGSADEAVALWPLDDRWMLVALGLPFELRSTIHLYSSFNEAISGRTTASVKKGLRRWMADHGLEGLAELDSETWDQRFGRSYANLSGGSLLERCAERTWWGQAAREELLRAARLVHSARVREASRRADWERPPPEPALQPLWALARSAYRAARRVQPPAHDERTEVDVRGLRILGPNGELIATLEPLQLLTQDVELLAGLLDRLAVDRPTCERLASRLAQPAWERLLGDLDDALRPPPAPEDDKPLLGWQLYATARSLFASDWEIVPVRCRPKKRGEGFVTRRETPDAIPAAMLEGDADRRLLTLLCTARSSPEQLLLGIELLRGMPRVFHADVQKGMTIRIERGEATIGLRREADGVRLVPTVAGVEIGLEELRQHCRLSRVGDRLVFLRDRTLWVVPLDVETELALLRVAAQPVAVPEEQLPRLMERLPGWAGRVRLDAAPGTLGPSVEVDDRPLLMLEMGEDGLRVEARLQPLPEVPSVEPGVGAPLLAATRDGAVVHVVRDLDAEPRRLERALAPLALPEDARDGFRWQIPDPQRALAVLEAARERVGTYQLRWSGARPSLLSRRAAAADLSLRVEAQRDWFGLRGTAEVDGQQVELSALVRAAVEGHSFVPLSGGQWVGIADELRERLAQIARAGTPRKDGVELVPLHATLLDPLAEEGAAIDAPEAWSAVPARLREAGERTWPIPEGLQAELRPYQAAGVRWLLQTAHWAPGACLADDMGLGKTLQAIALLLARADEPALVVAPTSVVFNWQRELRRFGPSLEPRVYWGSERSLDGIGPGQVWLTTYGVLQRDAERLAEQRFGVVVLDEAQAIKNPATLRARAAFGLQAGFKLALSGTPVENRTEELWSLFRFLAPGLLGSRARFQRVFVQPIESVGDAAVRDALARLVGPFLLRRTKGQVALDLPSRTELVRRVELSGAERALYERVRMECMVRIESGAVSGLQVATELLKLRKLACHPRLYDPGSPLQSAKLKAVRRTMADLRAGGHRALVFSQFTSHLALVREALEADGLTLRYLDGSMSLPAREAEVDAFQRGEGDAFLISLKAGGTGLNLTAATYVLHLDPWWNPAAEDQATDRAHRIGQDKPVVVLRFVAAGSVEEQIVALHEQKRALADALLAEQAGAGPLSPELVLQLLQTPLEEVSAVDDGEPTAVTPSPPPPTLVERPDASVEPTPPVAPAAEPAARALAVVLDGASLLERLEARLRGEGKKQSTLRNYLATAQELLGSATEPLTRDALGQAADGFVARAREKHPSVSGTAHVYAGRVWRLLQELL